MEVIGFSVMSNHLHVILRTRPDVVKTWYDDEVARRWWKLFPQRRNLELEPKRKNVREKCSSRRASNQGCIFMTLPQYLELLDWTGRQLKPGKRGAIPKNAPPILKRLNLSAELWLHAVEHFGKRRAANRITPVSRFNATASSVRGTDGARRASGTPQQNEDSALNRTAPRFG